MANLWLPVVPVAFSIAGLGIGLIIMGCQHKADADARVAPPTGAVTSTSAIAARPRLEGASATATGVGERTIDTSTSSGSIFAGVPSSHPAPVTTSRSARARAKRGSDDNLPAWVPLRGRLTVVQAPDLAENLGLVPKGTTRNAEARVSVAELLDKPTTSTSSTSSAATAQPATWLAANGRMPHGRSRR